MFRTKWYASFFRIQIILNELFGVSSKTKKLWIVTELFYPEETSTSYILTKIANKLCEKYEVHVICGPEAYELASTMTRSTLTLNKAIYVHRVSNVNLDKNKLLYRIVRFIILSIKLSFSLLKKVKKKDKVLIVTNPAPLLLFVSIIKKIKQFHLSILVHDVFPENTIPAGIFKSEINIIYRLIKAIFDKAYSTADRLIVLGRDMKEVLFDKTKNASISIIENWADIHSIFSKDRAIWTSFSQKDKNLIHIQYAGNIGRVQGLMELLSIIKEANNPLLHFNFIGEGALKSEMILFVEKNNMNNISFLGSYKRDEQNNILNSCDLSVVTLSSGMYGLGVPSKTYNILAAGKPIIFIGDKNSEIGLLINENEIGYCFSPNDKEQFLLFLKNLSSNELDKLTAMGNKARSLAEIKYSEEIILNKYLEIL